MGAFATRGRPSFLKTLEVRYEKARNEIADAVLGKQPPDQDVDITSAYQQSRVLLGDYVTLDWEHRQDVMRLIGQIKRYAEDNTRRRPLNIIMRAEPGSGKSHMVKCLARKLESQHASAVDYNMASLRSIEDLAQPLDQVRNQKVVDRLPLLFLDEFDSSPENYAMLLPLLWDGELHIGHRDLKLGKLVIILAGSGKTIEDEMKAAKAMQAAAGPAGSKLVDLLSRINGGELDIPPLDAVANNRDRRVDKVCLTAALLQSRFGERLETIPWALLRFVVLGKFRYGVRSIAHLVDLIRPLDAESVSLSLDDLTLPLKSIGALRDSSLAYHVFSEDGPAAITELWSKCCESNIAVRFKAKGQEEFEL